MTSHTCHTPFCWLLSCAVCASCAACAATLDPPRLVDDPAVSPDDPLRTAAEALGATPTGDEAQDDALDAASHKVWTRLVAHVTKGGRS